jgi:hypothetical protein
MEQTCRGRGTRPHVVGSLDHSLFSWRRTILQEQSYNREDEQFQKWDRAAPRCVAMHRNTLGEGIVQRCAQGGDCTAVCCKEMTSPRGCLHRRVLQVCSGRGLHRCVLQGNDCTAWVSTPSCAAGVLREGTEPLVYVLFRGSCGSCCPYQFNLDKGH